MAMSSGVPVPLCKRNWVNPYKVEDHGQTSRSKVRLAHQQGKQARTIVVPLTGVPLGYA